MTEYSFSPAAVERYQESQGRILTWRSKISPDDAPSPSQTGSRDLRRSHTVHAVDERQRQPIDPSPSHSSASARPTSKRAHTHHGHEHRRRRDSSPSHSSDTARPSSKRSHTHHGRRRPRHSRSHSYTTHVYPSIPNPSPFRSQTMPVTTVTDGRHILWHPGMPAQQCVWIPPHGQKVDAKEAISYANPRSASTKSPLARLKRLLQIFTSLKDTKDRSRSPSSSHTETSRGSKSRDDKGWLLVDTVPAHSNLIHYSDWNSRTGHSARGSKLRKYSQ